MSDSLTLVDIAFLDSERGTRLLESLADVDSTRLESPNFIQKLRETYSINEVHATIKTTILRRKALTKFGERANSMYLTDDALQQASDPLVRKYRAQFVEGKRVLDLCCGIGADSMAFGETASQILGIDIDPVRAAMAHHNCQHLDNITFEVADVREGIPPGYDFAFFDPARRDEYGKRIFDVEGYIPPLSLVNRWDVPNIAVKLSPGVDVDSLTEYDGRVEFISVEGQLKEAVLWLGYNRPSSRQATLLIPGKSPQIWLPIAEETGVCLSEPRGWLIEPDPAIIRAGLVRDAATQWNGCQLDETIAYLTSDHYTYTDWGRWWRILDWIPFHLKRLRAYLRERNVGTLTVKKRGFPIQPEELIAKLKPKGAESRTLVLTRLRGQPIVIICTNFGVHSDP